MKIITLLQDKIKKSPILYMLLVLLWTAFVTSYMIDARKPDQQIAQYRIFLANSDESGRCGGAVGDFWYSAIKNDGYFSSWKDTNYCAIPKENGSGYESIKTKTEELVAQQLKSLSVHNAIVTQDSVLKFEIEK